MPPSLSSRLSPLGHRRAARPVAAGWAALLLAAALASGAEPPPPAFREALAAQRLPLRLEEGRLTGPGADALLAAGREARFVLLGEDHGFAENAEIAAALFRGLAPSGVDTYAGEWGPLSAKLLTAAARDPRGLPALDEIQKRHPFSIAFAGLVEEMELYRTVAALSPRRDPLWGIDQEFIFAPGLLFDSLARRAQGETQEALKALVEREDAAYRTVVEKRNPMAGTMFMNQPLPESWDALHRAFAAAEDSEALATLEALAASREIYGHFFAGRYGENNQSRALYMKGRLREAFAGEEGGRKLLVKLGSNHVRRGFSPLGVQDVGNLLSELAAYHGGSSLHVLLLAQGGTQNAWLPFTPPEAKSVPLDTEGESYAGLRPLLTALQGAGTGWAFYDLRPLRSKLSVWTKADPGLEPLLRGFDAVIVLDKVRAARLAPSLEALAR